MTSPSIYGHVLPIRHAMNPAVAQVVPWRSPPPRCGTRSRRRPLPASRPSGYHETRWPRQCFGLQGTGRVRKMNHRRWSGPGVRSDTARWFTLWSLCVIPPFFREISWDSPVDQCPRFQIWIGHFAERRYRSECIVLSPVMSLSWFDAWKGIYEAVPSE